MGPAGTRPRTLTLRIPRAGSGAAAVPPLSKPPLLAHERQGAEPRPGHRDNGWHPWNARYLLYRKLWDFPMHRRGCQSGQGGVRDCGQCHSPRRALHTCQQDWILPAGRTGELSPIVVPVAEGSHRNGEGLPDWVEGVLHDLSLVANGEPGRDKERLAGTNPRQAAPQSSIAASW